MILSDNEKLVLACMELQADLSVPGVCQQTGLRAHTVQYCLKRLRERKIIDWIPFIDIYKLGLSYFGIFFSVSATVATTKKLVNILQKSEHVAWLAEVGGDFQYGVALVSYSAAEAATLFSNIVRKSNASLFQKSVSTRLAIADLPRGYLSKQTFCNGIKTGYASRKPYVLDAVEKKVLSATTQKSFQSYRKIAISIGIPPATFDKKLKKLQKHQIFKGATLDIDTASMDQQTFKLLISSRGIDSKLTEKLYQFAQKHLQIVHFVECFGEWDYELNIEVKVASEVGQIMSEISEKFGDRISTIKTISLLNVLKVSRYPSPSQTN